MMEDIYMGTFPPNWMSTKKIKHITFNITDDCNLACTYCYFINKSSHNKMTIDTAKKAIDYILSESQFDIYDGVVLDFIGGEPTLELKLIDEICDYIICSMYENKHKWLYCYKFMIGTNGLLYSTPEMQKLLSKHTLNFHVAITVDGSREKHNLSRKLKDGSGSYDIVAKQVPLWLKQTGNYSTKSTFAHSDLPYLKDSIINLWNMGIINVMANVVFEDCWEDGDEIIFEQQLKLLADYVIDNGLWDKYSVRFFDPNIGHPLSIYAEQHNFCGAKSMLTIGTKGELFPCVRFMDSALSGKPNRSIGEIDGGVKSDLLRPFYALDVISQSSEECLNCDVASGCAWCSGNNYCYSNYETIFDRKTFNCKMHKANVCAAEYFWTKFEKATGRISPMRRIRVENISKRQKYLYILLDTDTVSFCQYTKSKNAELNLTMDDAMVRKAIEFCDNSHYVPIFVGRNADKYFEYGLTISENTARPENLNTLLLNRNSAANSTQITGASLILSLTRADIIDLNNLIDHICAITSNDINIDILFEDLLEFTKDDLLLYKKQIETISEKIVKQWLGNRKININIITHGIFKNYSGACGAGVNRVALGPDGKFYLCPAFYFDECLKDKYVIGDLNNGIINDFSKVCDHSKNTGCRECGATHCNHCIYLSIKSTREFCVSPEIVCVKNNIERLQMLQLYDNVKDLCLEEAPLLNDKMDRRKYYDPLKLLHDNIISKFDME